MDVNKLLKEDYINELTFEQGGMEFPLTVPKGDKEIIKAHAEKHDGGSVNGFIQRAIKETMERDQQGGKA